MSPAKHRGAPGKGIRRAPGGAEPGRKARGGTGEETHVPWGRRNFVILAVGGGAVALGFVLLAVGDKVFAPILIVGGYLGLVPWGIMASTRPRRAGPDRPTEHQGE